MIKAYLKSSVGRKQIVAITGLALVLFLIAHLAGNLLIFKGPTAFNNYAAGLKSLGALLWVARLGLLATFVIHIATTTSLVIENIKARGGRYSRDTHGGSRSFVTRIMPYTGTILLVYVITHLLDYTLVDHNTVNTMIGHLDQGIYGMVVNSFQMSMARVLWYIVAMACVGFHLAHGFQSVFRSFGYYHTTFTPVLNGLSTTIGVLIFAGFSSIPVYVYLAL